MKSYNENIDIVKGVGIILVVIGHIIQFSFVEGGAENVDYIWIYKYHMDLFFFCSGFTFSNLEMDKGIKTCLNVIKSRTIRLMCPYVIWSIIAFAFYNESFTFTNLLHYLRCPHMGLWFLKSMYKYSIFIAILFYGLHYIRNEKSEKYIEMMMFACIVVFTYLIDDIHFMFFTIGLIFNRFINVRAQLNNSKIVAVASLVFVTSIFFNQIPSIFVAASAIIYFYNLGNKIQGNLKKQMIYLGKCSMPIFLIHPYVLTQLIISVPSGSLIVFIISTIMAIVLSIICLFLYKLSKVGILPILLYGEKTNCKNIEHSKL